MDLVGGSAVAVDGGVDVTLETAGDPAAYLASGPPSAAFVAEINTTDGQFYRAVHELHEGAHRDVVEVDHGPSAATLQVHVDGPRLTLQIRDVPSSLKGAKWSATTFVAPDPPRRKGDPLRVLCDLLMPLQTGVQDQEPPAATLPPAPPIGSGTGTSPPGTAPDVNVPTSLEQPNQAPEDRGAMYRAAPTADPASTAEPEPNEGFVDRFGRFLVAIAVLLGFTALIPLIYWLLRSRRRPTPPEGGSHGPSPTPPPESNDFGK